MEQSQEKNEDPREKAGKLRIQIEELLWTKYHYQRQAMFGESRSQRVEMLMKRYSAKKWSSEKKQKMVRRLVAAKQQISNASQMMERITDEINIKTSELSALNSQ